MDEFNSKYYQTPFRSKENFYEENCTTMDRTSQNIAFEKKRNFQTPKKYYSHRHCEIINEAPKKNFPYESKIRTEIVNLKADLFKSDDFSLNDDEDFTSDYYVIQKINGALTYYKIDNLFVLQGFLEWMITFNDIKDILYDIVKTFVKGYNDRSSLIYKFFNRGTFLEIIGLELNNLNKTLFIIYSEIMSFSEEFDISQIEAKDEKLFVSVQGKCSDLSNNSHNYILSYKITLVYELLKISNASLKDILRVDYIKIKILN